MPIFECNLSNHQDTAKFVADSWEDAGNIYSDMIFKRHGVTDFEIQVREIQEPINISVNIKREIRLDVIH